MVHPHVQIAGLDIFQQVAAPVSYNQQELDNHSTSKSKSVFLIIYQTY